METQYLRAAKAIARTQVALAESQSELEQRLEKFVQSLQNLEKNNDSRN